jgi:hypothetical protein
MSALAIMRSSRSFRTQTPGSSTVQPKWNEGRINLQSCESSRLRSFAFCDYWIFSVIMMVAFEYCAA